MSYDDCIAKVEKLENGYVVYLRDPEQDEKDSPHQPMSYMDQWVGYAFPAANEVASFLADNLEKATPAKSFDDAFEAEAAASASRRKPKSKN